MQRNFNTNKINNKNYVLKYALSAIHDFFMIDKHLKPWVVSSSLSKKHIKAHNLCHLLTKQRQTSKLPSTKWTDINDNKGVSDTSVHLLPCALVSQSTSDRW
jgi:hypothetical protein